MELFLHRHQKVVFGAEIVVGPSCGDLLPFQSNVFLFWPYVVAKYFFISVFMCSPKKKKPGWECVLWERVLRG